MSLTDRRLTKVYREAPRLCFDRCSRLVLMSDCHRGAGNHGDNFLNNQHLFFGALQYYRERGFTYVELGDGDELWENRRLDTIIQVHSDAFWLMSQFYAQGRLYMIYGNHDRKKQDQKYLCTHCEKYYCDSRDCECDLFPGLTVGEGIVLTERETGREIFLVHGHQGELLNDTLWYVARFLVRYVWKKMELAGFQDPTSTAKNYRRKKSRERALSDWAGDHGVLVIAGHTHRPVLPEPGTGLYANDGSCVHPRCITAMELERGALTLVKWGMLTRPDQSLYVGREVLAGPYPVREYFEDR